MEEKTSALLAAVDEGDEIEPGNSLWRDAWQRLCKNHLAVGGLGVVVVLVLLCFLGPLFYHYTYREQNLAMRVMPPSRQHWLGTDPLGRDLLARILYGGEVSLSVGLVATAVSLTIGVLYGSIAGFFGKRLDAVMMRIVDIMYALPFTIFVILLMVLFGRNIFLMFFAIGAVEWLTMARIVRGQVMSIKKMEYIEAARSLGFGR